MAEWLSRATLDIIGEGKGSRIIMAAYTVTLTLWSAGFDFDFGALDNSNNPVTHMYETLL